MSSAFILPSYFGTPVTTQIPGSKYDSKGRQLSFVETEVQRLERMALINASKSRSSSPSQSRQSNNSVITESYDPIGFLSNQPPEEYLPKYSDDFLFLSEDSSPTPFLIPTSRKSSPSFQPDHTRKRRSLSSIREEDQH